MYCVQVHPYHRLYQLLLLLLAAAAVAAKEEKEYIHSTYMYLIYLIVHFFNLFI